jgi:hypothetical protein
MTSVVNHIRAASVIEKEQDVTAVYNGRSPQPFLTQQKRKIVIPKEKQITDWWYEVREFRNHRQFYIALQSSGRFQKL